LLFQYGQKHNWCRSNPVREVKIPSDQDAVRINVLSRAQEEAYFAAVESLRLEKAAAQRTAQVRALEDLDDPHRLMLRQGCRPEELRQLRRADVDLEHGRFRVSGWLFPSHRNPGQHMGPSPAPSRRRDPARPSALRALRLPAHLC
jgi:integrase